MARDACMKDTNVAKAIAHYQKIIEGHQSISVVNKVLDPYVLMALVLDETCQYLCHAPRYWKQKLPQCSQIHNLLNICPPFPL